MKDEYIRNEEGNLSFPRRNSRCKGREMSNQLAGLLVAHVLTESLLGTRSCGYPGSEHTDMALAHRELVLLGVKPRNAGWDEQGQASLSWGCMGHRVSWSGGVSTKPQDFECTSIFIEWINDILLFPQGDP